MFDLSTAKTRLGITDATQDVELQLALDASLAFAEKYCDRHFAYASEKAIFYHTHDGSLQLHRYPLEQVISVVPTVKYQAHLSAGIIDFHGVQYKEKIEISYAGGYKTLPADLEIAFWDIFDGVWASLSAGGATTLTAGSIQSITLQDVGTVRYSTGGSGSGASASGNIGGAIPDRAASILNFYRLQKC